MATADAPPMEQVWCVKYQGWWSVPSGWFFDTGTIAPTRSEAIQKWNDRQHLPGIRPSWRYDRMRRRGKVRAVKVLVVEGSL